MINEVKKIIVVDDSIVSLTAIKNALKDIYDVYTTTSTQKMFDLLNQITPDLILLDIDMPEINCYETAKILKENESHKEVPIIFITALTDPQSEILGLNLGAIDYIHKPIIGPLLIRRIKTYLSLIDHQLLLKERNDAIEKLLHQKTREINLRKVAEMEAKNASRAKSEFLHHISQEIRNPLNAIIGMTSIALTANDVQKAKSHLKRADDAAKYLLNIVNDIYDISMIESNKFELSTSVFNFDKMMEDIITSAMQMAEDKSINLITKIDADIHPYIICDGHKLSQAITNLLNNAIKFTPDGGSVVLIAGADNETDENVVLRIEVADTGIGITEEQQARLFKSYHLTSGDVSQKHGGTGLGLVITQKIIELMNGRIWIESEINKGTKFIFTVNVQKMAEGDHEVPSGKIHLNDLRILAVDDSTVVRGYFSQVMRTHGYSFDTAESSLNAIDMIIESIREDRPYNMFFVDWMMPEMDGIELTRRIKDIVGKRAVVVLFSVADWAIVEKEARLAGVSQFIQKPLQPSAINDVISEYVNTLPDEVKTDKGTVGKRYNFFGHTILAAEGTAINRELMLAVLEDTGLDMEFADTGQAAITLFELNHAKYSFILMDTNLDDIDGQETTKTIRAMNIDRAKTIPIIAMTPETAKQNLDKCFNAGMTDYIAKPINPDSLLHKIGQYIDSIYKNTKPPTGDTFESGIKWDASLEFGNKRIDDQHRDIINMVNSLINACSASNDVDMLQETLNYVVNYTNHHFADEEELQIKHNYPGYVEHKMLHDEFKEIVDTLMGRFKESSSAKQLSDDLNKYLVRWLVKHVSQEDKKISTYLKRSMQ